MPNVVYMYLYTLFLLIAAKVPYNITVRALNLAGCGQEQQIYCFTQEGQGMILITSRVPINKKILVSDKYGWLNFHAVHDLTGLNFGVLSSSSLWLKHQDLSILRSRDSISVIAWASIMHTILTTFYHMQLLGI